MKVGFFAFIWKVRLCCNELTSFINFLCVVVLFSSFALRVLSSACKEEKQSSTANFPS